MLTPILGIAEVSPTQLGKFDTINAMFTAMEGSLEDVLVCDLSSGNLTVSTQDFTTHHVFHATGNATARTLTFPAIKRVFAVFNGGNAALTVAVSGGSTSILPAGDGAVIHSDGAASAFCAESNLSIPFTQLTDVPQSYSGAGTEMVSVNSGATGLTFRAKGSETPATVDLTTEYTTNNPSAPSTGLTAFTRKRAGRNGLASIDPHGIIADFQTSFIRRTVDYALGSGPSPALSQVLVNNPSVYCFGAGVGGSIYMAQTQPTDTSFFALQRRSYVFSGTGTQQDISVYFGSSVARGSVTNTGGFFVLMRFGFKQIQSDSKLFFGLSATTGPNNSAWSSASNTTQSLLGIIKEPSDTGLYLIQKNTNFAVSTTYTKTPLNWSTPTAGVDYYEFRIYCPPAGVPTYSLQRMNTGDVIEGAFTSGASLPAATMVMNPSIWAQSSQTTSSVAEIHFSKFYVECGPAVI